MSRLYRHEGIDYEEERARRAVEWLRAHPESGGVWLIHSEDRPVGHLVITVGCSLEFGGRFGLLDEFYVDEPSRGRGIGAQALLFAEDVCRDRGLRFLRLEVGRENTRAVRLYERSGFRVHDRNLMTKRL